MSALAMPVIYDPKPVTESLINDAVLQFCSKNQSNTEYCAGFLPADTAADVAAGGM